jgi:hypothetical protein
MLVVLYDTHTSYINVILKEYSYLFLYNNDKYNNTYEFKNSGLFSRCEKEYGNKKVIRQCIKSFYYIEYQFLSNEKKIN